MLFRSGGATLQAAAPSTGGSLAAAGTGMAVADQSQMRSGGQTVVMNNSTQQTVAQPAQQTQAAMGEVPLNIRLQKQYASTLGKVFPNLTHVIKMPAFI